ncbi:uncharacterized protein LOC109795904 [Cajanus cajan]|uniref:uncharacterized protein LOC109795904 n=1 Tax=Cajanus cajan TaxID=3821 RepID=UPI0010FB0820|nr:uncharacterized protein LOC109795904 [Cajanus cajan]
MEFFQRAEVVRLRSHHDKYMLADDDEGVFQDRNGTYKNAKWTVEMVEGSNLIRLKSCYGKYLTASNMPFLLGATGKKVLQTLPPRLDLSLGWEPLREGVQVRLRTRYGQYLRANGGLPPWRNSITHDIPHRTSTANWILWDVDLVQLRPTPPKPIEIATPNTSMDSPPPYHHDSAQIDLKSPKLSIHEQGDVEENASPKKDGRIIFYNVGDEHGSVPITSEEKFFTFKGSSVDDLKEKLKEETGHDDIIVCCRNPFTAKLCPLHLQLPPNNTDMHVVVVTPSYNA